MSNIYSFIILIIYIYIYACVCITVIYISNSMFGSINEKLERFLVKDVYLHYIPFSTVSVKKECLFLCYVGNNEVFLFDLMQIFLSDMFCDDQLSQSLR